MPTTFSSRATDQHQSEYKDIHYHVGSALSTWMGVEAQCQQTFAIAMRSQPQHAAKAVFRAAISANAKLAMLDQAVRHCLHSLTGGEDLLLRWPPLYKRAQRLARSRNAIAHGQAVWLMGQPDANGNSVSIGVRVVDPLKDQSDQIKQIKEGISTDDIKTLQEDFHALGFDLYTHGQELQAFLAQQK